MILKGTSFPIYFRKKLRRVRIVKLLVKVEWRFATELNRLVYKDAYSLIETEACQ